MGFFGVVFRFLEMCWIFFFFQIQQEREELPVKNFESEILDAVHHNSVVVIRGATGCGKTTQVPQYILDEYIRTNRAAECNIVVTQVRNTLQMQPLKFSDTRNHLLRCVEKCDDHCRTFIEVFPYSYMWEKPQCHVYFSLGVVFFHVPTVGITWLYLAQVKTFWQTKGKQFGKCHLVVAIYPYVLL